MENIASIMIIMTTIIIIAIMTISVATVQIETLGKTFFKSLCLNV